MRINQGKSFHGQVRIKISGRLPERFLQELLEANIPLWDIQKVSNTSCEASIYLRDLQKVRHVKRKSEYSIKLLHGSGLPFRFRNILRKKPMILAVIISFFIILFLANIIWEVKIEGVSTEIEKKIHKQLTTYGIYPGASLWKLDDTAEIQHDLMHDIPELLWVGVEKNGTALHFEAVEKRVAEEKEIEGPRNLVAKKSGVITKTFVANGQPIVHVDDFVEKGDVLVSGKIESFDKNISKGNIDEEENTKKYKQIEAEGEIRAKTWYEIDVTIPLDATYETLSGEQTNRHYLKFGSFQLPVWGFKEPKFDSLHYEHDTKDFHLFKWELPWKYVHSTIHEKTYEEIKRTKEEAREVGIKQAKQDLQLELGPDAQILTEKVLHESIENGKVKLTIYITVDEDITKYESIGQSD